MERRFDAVIFDLDGTLLDTLDDLTDSINAALNKYGLPIHSKEAVRTFIGSGSEMLARRAVAPINDEQLVEKVHTAFRKIYPVMMKNKTAPYSGINEVLETLGQNGIKMAVMSNKPHDAVVPLIKDYFGDRIPLAAGADKDTPEKPNPVGTLRVLEKLGTEKSRTVYMGDSDIDIFTAKNAGLFALGCSWGFRDRDLLEKSGADFVIDSPYELIELLGL